MLALNFCVFFSRFISFHHRELFVFWYCFYRQQEELGTEYLVRPLARAEDEEHSSDFEPDADDEDNNDEDEDVKILGGISGVSSGKDLAAAPSKKRVRDDDDEEEDDDDDDDSSDDDVRPSKKRWTKILFRGCLVERDRPTDFSYQSICFFCFKNKVFRSLISNKLQ